MFESFEFSFPRFDGTCRTSLSTIVESFDTTRRFTNVVLHIFLNIYTDVRLGEFYTLLLLRQVVTRRNVIKASCYQGELLSRQVVIKASLNKASLNKASLNKASLNKASCD